MVYCLLLVWRTQLVLYLLSLNFFKHLLAREINVTVLMATEARFYLFPSYAYFIFLGLLCLLISENESLIYNKLRAGGERGDRRWWLDGITNSMDTSLKKLRDSEGQGSLVCCSPWGCKELDTTWWLHNLTHFFETPWTSGRVFNDFWLADTTSLTCSASSFSFNKFYLNGISTQHWKWKEKC